MLVVIFLTLTILASACIDPTPPVSGFTPTWFCPPSDSGLSINELLAEYYCEGSPNPLYLLLLLFSPLFLTFFQ